MVCVKKTNGTISAKLRLKMKDFPKLKWSSLLQNVINDYNATPHSATGFAPRFLLFGLHDKPDFIPASELITLEKARKIAVERSNSEKDHRKEKYDSRHKPHQLRIGDQVVKKLPENHPSIVKTSPRNTGPYEIVKIVGSDTFEITCLKSGKTIQAHSSQLKKFHPRMKNQDAGE